MLIDDALNTENAEKNRFCLDMSCSKPDEYPKCVVKKISWQPPRYGSYPVLGHNKNWNFGVSAKAENLIIKDNGYIRMRIERWQLREGVNPDFTAECPDETLIINIPEGSYSYTDFNSCIEIVDDDTACIIVTLEGQNYSGNIYFECPHLTSSNGHNVLPEFDRGVLEEARYAWLGLNISKKEWPQFRISVNGKEFFNDEVFLRIHRYSPVEIDIPDGMLTEGENVLSITYTSDYHDTVPIAIHEAVILEKPKEEFSVLFCPEIAVIGQNIHILIETELDNIELKLESDDFVPASPLVFAKKGLNVVSLRATKQKNNMSLKLMYGDISKKLIVSRSVRHTQDNVVCGSGDMIYTDVSSCKAVSDYLGWYISNRLGNLVTIRTVYRWGGQRTVNPDVWKLFTKICRDMNFEYVHISDGRDLPGLAQNPTFQMLDGKGFLGRQLHERDGQLFYWATPRETIPTVEVFYDLALRLQREHPDTIEGAYRAANVQIQDGKYIFRRDITCRADMKEAHDLAAAALRDMRDGGYPRHTGPAVMFKYFYQQGFDWTGAETMDGSSEPQLAFLRGASKAYGRERYGVHHALQWSTNPHDTEQRYRRYILALYLSYMHGVTDINTEEDLWFMEARYSYHNRLSEACESHRKQERRLYKFIALHSRTGRFYTQTAFLHGRYDGWNGFSSDYLWGMPHIPLGDESASWKLLKIFYPLNHIENYGMYKVGYIPADNNKPFGIFSGTPNGNIDVVPIEHGDLSQYSLLSFAGYNSATSEDFDRLHEFVKNGGTLIGSWPHFSETTLKEDIDNCKHCIIEHPLTKILSDGTPKFVSDTVNGKEIRLCSNLPENIEIEEKTDSGNPLVYTVACEKGKIIVINCLFHPGNEAIYGVYKRVIRKHHENVAKSAQYEILCGEDVEYTTFIQENGTYNFYLTPVDWYNDPIPKRNASIRIGEIRYPIECEFGGILKIAAGFGFAAWTDNEDAEILEIHNNKIVVQGAGNILVHVVADGKVSDYALEFREETEMTINI